MVIHTEERVDGDRVWSDTHTNAKKRSGGAQESIQHEDYQIEKA